MTEVNYPRHQAHLDDDRKTPVAQVSRLRYRYERYRRPAEAIAGMRALLLEGWRIVQIRGPADGPFEVACLRAVSRDR